MLSMSEIYKYEFFKSSVLVKSNRSWQKKFGFIQNLTVFLPISNIASVSADASEDESAAKYSEISTILGV